MKTITIELTQPAYRELQNKLRRSGAEFGDNGHITMSAGTEIHCQRKCKPIDLDVIDIIDLVCLAFRDLGVHRSDIFGPSRKSGIVTCRHTAMALVREVKCMSMEETAYVFNREHTGVHYAEQSVHDRLETDTEYRAVYEMLREKLRAK